jgi:hypothetical protein
MHASHDPALCTAYLACPNYLAASKQKKPRCEKCRGDITGHTIVTRACDRILDPIINQSLTATPDEMVDRIVQAAHDIRAVLSEECIDVEAAEVGLLIPYRLMQRLAHANTQIGIIDATRRQ